MVKKTKSVEYYEAIGRRKEAVARVRLYLIGKDKTASLKGKKISPGQVIVNGKNLEEIFPKDYEKKTCLRPLVLTENLERFGISILVRGGGKSAQPEAIAHGISRALIEANAETYKTILRQNGLVTRDDRTRERRKVGTGGKARRQKQSPKR
ncbi:MAG: 30S ribosomal protein S9 [bacterium]|nr:30S ribosomal protein S9 [bacterium]